MSMYSALGWGVFELAEISFDKRRATVRALENVECKSFNRPSPEPKSNFVRGHLSGLFTEVFEERMDAKEVRCYSVGDEYCEFSLFPATE
jgi:predicted hydrocarbon binding protein